MARTPVDDWRVEELDGGVERRRPFDAVDVAAVGAVMLVVVSVALGTFPNFGAPGAPVTTPRATVRAAELSFGSPLALVAREATGGCGPLTEDTPAPAFGSGYRYARRIDRLVSVASDPSLSWCVAGVRAYDAGLDVVGPLQVGINAGLSDAAARRGERPLLAAPTFRGDIDGFGTIGEATLAVDPNDHTASLRFTIPAGPNRQQAFGRTTASSMTLRLVSLGGAWAFPPAPLDVGALDSNASRLGLTFRLRELKIQDAGIAITYEQSDSVARVDWEAFDDLGTTYRTRSSGTDLLVYPRPPTTARSLALSVRRVYLATSSDFELVLPWAK